MGNLGGGLAKFLQNKNTVTVIGVVAAILVLFIGYNMRLNSKTSPIAVPYAKDDIKGGIQITSDMVGVKEVPAAAISDGVLVNQGDIIDKYTRPDSIIPAGSFFYKKIVVEEEQLPANIILKYPKGHVLYNMPVDISSTYGNSIYPENYIDIYLKAVNKMDENQILGNPNDANKIMYGLLIKNVKVLAVKDSSGQAVFANLDEQRTPAMIVFSLPEDMYILLKKASFLRSYDTSLIPVPTNESLQTKPGELQVASEDLKNWINRVTAWTDTN